MAFQVQLGLNPRMQQAHQVRECRGAEPRCDLLCHGRAADDGTALEHQWSQSVLGEVGRTHQPVVSTPDDDCVGLVRHDELFGSGCPKKNIMPVIFGRLSARLSLLACLVAALGAAGVLGAANLHRGWGHYREPARAGPEEVRIGELVLGDQGLETRFDGLFEYFAHGFIRHAVPGYARVQYGGAGSRNGYAMDGLEGFARTAPLLAAWIYSGRNPVISGLAGTPSVNMTAILRSGILHGVDPASSQYWGGIHGPDQRVVEAADVARTLWLTRATVWDTLNAQQRTLIRAWLLAAAATPTPRTNWMLFPVVISVILASLDPQKVPQDLLERAHAIFAGYQQFYLANGWFYDRPHGVDFYNVWGITYDLAWIQWVDPGFAPDFIPGAIQQSADLTQHLVGPRGIPIMGRSVCYRTAVPVPLLAATLLPSSSFPVGRAVRGLDVVWRYFVAHDSLRDGALTQGYFQADLRLLDRYSGTGSCHWGLRSLVLAFMHPRGDSFWSAAPEPLPVEQADYRLELTRLGWIVEGRRDSGEITITIPRNLADINTIDEYSWVARAEEVVLPLPLRPSNHDIKYNSRHYSSAAPFPLKN